MVLIHFSFVMKCNEGVHNCMRITGKHPCRFNAAILWSDNVDPKTRTVSGLFG